METITCVNEQCGIDFCVPEGWHKRRRETGKQFYCPNGHVQHYEVGKSELDKMTERCMAAEGRADIFRRQRDNANASRNSYRGHVTRLKNKASESSVNEKEKS